MIKKVTIAILVFSGFFITAFSFGNRNLAPKMMSAQPDGMKEQATSFVVLELFTSQGCSSCPAADVLLEKMKQKYPENVYALSYHVDYWNYIGWEDPFSRSEHTEKQGRYNKKFGYRGNYTPEVVVNGKNHFVGSDARKMQHAVATYGQDEGANSIRLSDIGITDKKVDFRYFVTGTVANKKIRTVLVLDKRVTDVKRGENRNRTVTNSNIVVSENQWNLEKDEGTGAIAIPDIVEKDELLYLMVLISNAKDEITGAAKVALQNSTI
ncbi:DUF1223 domain-containing protein [Maribacter sp. 2-571]|uniref:DUF1223 domain-containing protein n=1 Tax=Maribacter sp. 2-571 TaxID=3417569 RepID=UPI003D33EBFE